MITPGRSGSTSLMRAIQALDGVKVPADDIVCPHNELVIPHQLQEHIEAYRKLTGKPILSSQDLIEAFFDRHADARYAGFKTMHNRHSDWRVFFARSDIQFITLRRRDVPSTVASLVIALERQVWDREGGQYEEEWTFTPASAQRVAAMLAHVFNGNQLLGKIPGAIGLFYEDLCRPGFSSPELDRFFDAHIALANAKPPVNGSQYVTNWDEFCRFLKPRWDALVAGGDAGRTKQAHQSSAADATATAGTPFVPGSSAGSIDRVPVLARDHPRSASGGRSAQHRLGGLPGEGLGPASDKVDLVLLPGSLGIASQLQSLGSALADNCRLHYLELPGHAGRPLPDKLSVPAMAADVLAQMDGLGVGKAYLLGYSFGGYVALYMAHVARQRILGVCNIAAKVVMDERAVRRGLMWARENYLSKPGSQNRMQLESFHPGTDLNRMIRLFADLYKDLGVDPPLNSAEFRALDVPCLTICGDRDPMVSWNEAAGLALMLPRSHCFTFIGRAHPLEELPLDHIGAVVNAWLRMQR